MGGRERFTGQAGPALRTSSAKANAERSVQPSCYGGKMVVRASPRSHPKSAFNGVKVFAATMFRDREQLGERVTHWLAEHSELDVVDLKVTQSSDAEFHCVTISVFYLEGDRLAR
jgi:hypothetical protein